MMCATRSREVQPSQGVVRSQAPGASARAKNCSASVRTTRRMVSLPSYDIAFHVLMPGASLLVELASAEVHERVAEQLDLDAVRVLEVHRLLDPEVGTGVVHSCLVQPTLRQLPLVARHGDRDV